MRGRLTGVVVSSGAGLLLGGQLVIAGGRIDLFDLHSNRTGYILVDPKSGRLIPLMEEGEAHRVGHHPP